MMVGHLSLGNSPWMLYEMILGQKWVQDKWVPGQMNQDINCWVKRPRYVTVESVIIIKNLAWINNFKNNTNSSSMKIWKDGNKVILYLIQQCLTLPALYNIHLFAFSFIVWLNLPLPLSVQTHHTFRKTRSFAPQSIGVGDGGTEGVGEWRRLEYIWANLIIFGQWSFFRDHLKPKEEN